MLSCNGTGAARAPGICDEEVGAVELSFPIVEAAPSTATPGDLLCTPPYVSSFSPGDCKAFSDSVCRRFLPPVPMRPQQKSKPRRSWGTERLLGKQVAGDGNIVCATYEQTTKDRSNDYARYLATTEATATAGSSYRSRRRIGRCGTCRGRGSGGEGIPTWAQIGICCCHTYSS